MAHEKACRVACGSCKWCGVVISEGRQRRMVKSEAAEVGRGQIQVSLVCQAVMLEELFRALI